MEEEANKEFGHSSAKMKKEKNSSHQLPCQENNLPARRAQIPFSDHTMIIFAIKSTESAIWPEDNFQFPQMIEYKRYKKDTRKAHF
jgi:hypothetical protein